MVNEILMRGATPVAPVMPVQAPGSSASPADEGFGKALLAELEGPATGGAPMLAAPRAVSLETMPVSPPMMVAPPPVLPAAAPAAASGSSYTVQAGDSLSKIARQMGHGHWKQLYVANRNTIGANPDQIKPGQVLTLPANWQASAARVGAVEAPKPIQAAAAVEPQATSPETIGTLSAPPGAPAVPAAAPTIEAASEPAPVAPLAGMSAAPSLREIAGEAIDSLSAEPGGGADHLGTLREALKSIPPGDISYDAYRAKVEGYEAAVNMGPNGTQLPAMAGAEGAYGPDAPPAGPPPSLNAPVLPADPAGAVPFSAAPTQVAPAAAASAAPLPTIPEDAGDGSGEGEEDWQAFS